MLEARVDRLEAALIRLAEAQARTDEQFGLLAQAQRRTEERLDRLTARVDDLTRRVDELAAMVQQLTEQVAGLTREAARHNARLDRLDGRLGTVQGRMLEMTYRDRAPAYFDDILRRIHALSAEELARLLDDSQQRGAITAPDRRELLLTDVVVYGREHAGGTPAYLAVEVSALVDEDDVWRALRRAELLARATQATALPVVAGEAITNQAEELGRSRGVWRVLDGRAVEPSRPQA